MTLLLVHFKNDVVVMPMDVSSKDGDGDYEMDGTEPSNPSSEPATTP